jgi:hypothetical protein
MEHDWSTLVPAGFSGDTKSKQQNVRRTCTGQKASTCYCLYYAACWLTVIIPQYRIGMLLSYRYRQHIQRLGSHKHYPHTVNEECRSDRTHYDARPCTAKRFSRLAICQVNPLRSMVAEQEPNSDPCICSCCVYDIRRETCTHRRIRGIEQTEKCGRSPSTSVSKMSAAHTLVFQCIR